MTNDECAAPGRRRRRFFRAHRFVPASSMSAAAFMPVADVSAEGGVTIPNTKADACIPAKTCGTPARATNLQFI
ncbi:MAG TPA: hypothetical protein VEY11_11050 [Pyrinomonadaceae bacterium]|nr:hypothetical protein [Pyrinomonadaceae bacterium]